MMLNNVFSEKTYGSDQITAKTEKAARLTTNRSCCCLL
jgi:hypothetical protein